MNTSSTQIIKVIFVCIILNGTFGIGESLAMHIGYQPADPVELFGSDAILDLRLEGDIRALMKDRDGDPSYYPMKLHYQTTAENTLESSLEVRVRQRGNFRRLEENCERPPLKFNLKKSEIPKESLFHGQLELKVVVPCQGDRYVIREYQIYKAFNLLTDYSFKVRLVRLTYHDVNRQKTTEPEYGFLIEDEEKLASRNFAEPYKKENLRPENMQLASFLRMSVFNYLIGNTDWSVQFRHNVKIMLLEEERVYVPVPYDFDLSGIVAAPYAKPAEELKLKSVRERLYRGYCLDDLQRLNPIFQEFQIHKQGLYAIFTESELLDKRYIDATLAYLDEFYETIGNPEKSTKVFSYPCDESGTGNIVISGLRNGQSF